MNGPKHLCIDNDGSVLIADTENHRIVRYNPNDGTLSAVAGTGKKGTAGVGGDPLKAEFNQPHWGGRASEDRRHLYLRREQWPGEEDRPGGTSTNAPLTPPTPTLPRERGLGGEGECLIQVSPCPTALENRANVSFNVSSVRPHWRTIVSLPSQPPLEDSVNRCVEKEDANPSPKPRGQDESLDPPHFSSTA